MNENQGYFSIRINSKGIILAITYLGVTRIPIENILKLYGMREKYFNRLVSRFDDGLIDDFIKYGVHNCRYFQQPIALCLFYDKFTPFAMKLRHELQNGNLGDLNVILADLKANPQNFGEIYKRFDLLPTRKGLDKNVFGYLQDTEVYKSIP